jgi:tetratricopeptide (TPR) repeat protein
MIDHFPFCLQGLCLERAGLLDEALACQAKAVACSPELAEAHRALGRLSEDPDEVVESLERASALVPNDFALRCQLGTALLTVGRLGESLECGKAAAAAEPHRFEALVVVGDAADGLERYTAAAAAYRQAAAVVVDTRAKFNLKSAADGGASKAAAVEALRQAFRPFETSPGLMDASGMVLLMDALGVPASSPALQALRDKIADKATAKATGSFFVGKRRKNEVDE